MGRRALVVDDQLGQREYPLLRINPGAFAKEVEAAYCKRRDEVQLRLEAARDRNTRTRCEREFLALEQARNIFFAGTEDITIKPE